MRQRLEWYDEKASDNSPWIPLPERVFSCPN